MTDWLTSLISTLVLRVLPPDRKEWGSAMRAEIEHIEDRATAITFSLGCLAAAVTERARHVPSQALVFRGSVSFIIAAFAVFHIGCAARGASILLGARDPYYELLLSGSASQQLLAGAYQAATPFVVPCLAVMGVGHALAAYFLVHQKQASFVAAASVAVISSFALCGAILWIGESANTIPVQLAASIILAVLVPPSWQFNRRAAGGLDQEYL